MPLRDQIEEYLRESGRWRETEAPHLRWVDLAAPSDSGAGLRAFSLEDAVARELARERA
jgi:hypothetical protein